MKMAFGLPSFPSSYHIFKRPLFTGKNSPVNIHFMDTEIINVESKSTPTLDIIYHRRAVRKYKDKPVERTLIEQVIDAGRMAPSAMNKQPWKFYVLTEKTAIRTFSKEIAAIALKRAVRPGIKKMIKATLDLLHFSHGIHFQSLVDPIFHGAPAVIFITAPADNEWASLDIGMCSQNIMLAAKSLGLDTCPVGLGKFVEKTKIFPRLNILPSERVLISIILGYGDENPAPHEKKQDSINFIY